MARMRVDEVICILEDIYSTSPNDPDAAVKLTKRAAWAADKLPRYLALLQARYTASGGPFLLGSAISIADLALVALAQMLTSGQFDGVPTTAMNGYPAIGAAYAAACADADVAEELATLA